MNEGGIVLGWLDWLAIFFFGGILFVVAMSNRAFFGRMKKRMKKQRGNIGNKQ